ncbi:YbaB/EbfC family nucleoid-associated protein [Thioalkalivibrio thiocyanodenitrificans]|uniref:YbaB/EbfC family nucleoid-associated protein n=1 Tax=Thioalkalivibrio thiocyanodenitrificans TaxID=243063 RepID=UPI000476BAB0|nr:YbaB/EbfC family nucleoid-associated protein [Thioalkalivibrio thiocyanodenitrificans]
MISNTMKAGKVLKSAFKTQAALRQLKKEISAEEFSAADPEKGIEVRVRGDHKLVEIKAPALSGDDTRDLADLINQAIENADAEIARRSSEITKGTAFDGTDLAL